MFKKLKLQKGNHKLDSGIVNWSLPPISTCPGSTLQCRSHCYAMKSFKQYPNVRNAWQENYEETKSEDFVENMLFSLIKLKKVVAVRIHVAGDFYSQEYFDKWCKIANRINIKFYAYTKNFALDLNNKPDNFTLLASDDDNKYPNDLLQELGFDGKAVVIDKLSTSSIGYTCPYPNNACGNWKDNKCEYCFDNAKEFKIVNFNRH